MQAGFEVFVAPLKKERKLLLAVSAALVFLSCSQSLFLVLLGPFLRGFLSLSQDNEVLRLIDVLPSSLASYLPKSFAVEWARDRLFKVVAYGLVGAASLRSVSIYIYQVSTAELALKVAKSFRDHLFTSLLHRPFLDISVKSPSEWMSYLMNDVLFLQTSFTDVVNSCFRDGMVVSSALLTMFVIHWPTGLVLLLLTPVIAFGMGRAGKKIAYYADHTQLRLALMTNFVLQLRRRYTFIRAQGGEEYEKNRFSLINHQYYQFIRKSLLIRSSFAPAMEFFGFAMFAGIVGLVSYGLFSASLRSDHLLVFFATLGLLFRPLRSIGEQAVKYRETMGALERSLAILNHPSRDLSSGIFLADQAPEPQSPETPVVIPLEKFLEIRHLEVSYLGNIPNLSLSSLDIKPGRAVAVIGPSGGGKSTLVKCLAGLVPPKVWKANVQWSELVNDVSMVSQSPFLFQDSIRSNLVYGLERELPSQEIFHALDLVEASHEVSCLEGGLDYQVRSVGQNLSGGQVQRLVLARALLRRAPVLLLDEATSAVDHRTEKSITLNLIEACHVHGTSLLAVTHRLQCLPLFDEVWFIESGKLVMRGRHDELLKESRYSDFYGNPESN